MKILFSVCLLTSSLVFADDHEEDKPMYEANVAEYYFLLSKKAKIWMT